MKFQKPLILSSNEVHIWSAFLEEDINNLLYFYSILSEDERQRANSFRFSKNQKYFIIARGILRCLLSYYLERAPEKIEFVYGLWGKPRLLGETLLNFNISHSREYALYAITSSYEVGIDLEYIDDDLELEDLAPFIFSATELSDWRHLGPEERVNAFFRRWVSKEAFLKALGTGWCKDEKGAAFKAQNILKKRTLNDEAANSVYFNCIPGYASAFFGEDALLHPLYYSWHQSCLKYLL